MAILKVAQIGHPCLRVKASPLTREALASRDTQALIDNLIETMRDAAGAGLAATQVHEAVQICVIEVKDNPRYPYKPNIPLTVLVNPVLTPQTPATFENFEGCLSVPDLRGMVRRFLEVRIEAWDRHGNPIDTIVRGITAGTYQHECDHLDGTLFIDRVEDPRTFCTWKEFARQHEPRFREHVREIVEHFGS